MALEPPDRAALESRLRLELEKIQDAEHWTFDMARDGDEAENYAFHVIRRVQEAGPIRAAAEDVAHALGVVDYGETMPAVTAVLRQWHAAADVLPAASTSALQLRYAALQLEDALQDEDFDPDHFTDVIAIASDADAIADAAAMWAKAVEEGDDEEWWRSHGERVASLVEAQAYLRADLVHRGEDE